MFNEVETSVEEKTLKGKYLSTEFQKGFYQNRFDKCIAT